MKEPEFINALKELSPKKEDLIDLGFSEYTANEFIFSYTGISKGTDKKVSSDSILNLFENYDVSNIIIGMISFNPNVLESSDYYFIGKIEVDYLVIDKKNKSIKVVDATDEVSIVWECAVSSDAFLDAIIELADFSTRKIFDDNLWKDTLQANKTALICSNKAGGDRYLNFYKMLCS